MRLEGDRISPPEGLVEHSGIIFMEVVLSFSVVRGESQPLFKALIRGRSSCETPEKRTSLSVVDSLLYHGNVNQTSHSFANQITRFICAPVTQFVIG